MATDKRISYEMQGHKKPARNYLGKQKTVKNIPIKWKSGPKAPQTELAYITKAEKNLLLKKDLHGSLQKGPNTGPDGIMSLDSQGDYTRDRSPGAYTGGGGGGSPAQQSTGTGTSQQALRDRAIKERDLKAILTGQISKGQTSAVSDRVRRGAVPEWVTTPSGKRKYVGSAYKSTGQQGWLSKLLGGSGYRGTVGTGSGRFFDRKSSIGKYNPVTGLYESEEENVGDLKPGMPNFGLMGLIQSLKNKFKKPRDMSQFNTLGAAQTGTASDVPMAQTDRWTQPIDNTNILPLAKPDQTYADKAKNFLQIPSIYAGENELINLNQGNNTTGSNVTNNPPNAVTGNYGSVDQPNAWSNFMQSNEAMGGPTSILDYGAKKLSGWLGNKFQDGGRAGYAFGEGPVLDENVDENTQGEMAGGQSAFDLRIEELMGKGLSYDDAYDIAAHEFQDLFAEGQEGSSSEEGLASLV